MGISLKQYEALCRKRVKEPIFDGSKPNKYPLVIIGIDPSLRGTGYGVIKISRGDISALGYGTIRCPKDWERSRCLVKIAATIRTVLKKNKPDLCVIEGLFYAQNVKTALLMGEARGVSLLTVAETGIDIYEIAPRKVKKAITGYGAAQKKSVALMVQRMLNLKKLPEPDASDALALALTYAQEWSGYYIKPLQKI
mgnify:CR=1 FL=1